MISVAVFIFGLVVGSFLNVVIYRLPRGEGIVWGHSRCTHCRHELAWYQLIPLVSFIAQRGRCPYCNKNISWRYPLIELATAGLALGIWHGSGSYGNVYIICAFFIACCVLSLGIIDFEHLLLPDSLIIAAGLVSGAYAWYAHLMHVSNPWHTFSYGGIISALLMTGVFFALWYLSKGAWVGFGDVKLLGVFGLLFGFPGALVILYGGVLLGGITGIVLLVSGRGTRKTKLPFGTFLCTTALAYILLFPSVLDHITNFFG